MKSLARILKRRALGQEPGRQIAKAVDGRSAMAAPFWIYVSFESCRATGKIGSSKKFGGREGVRAEKSPFETKPDFSVHFLPVAGFQEENMTVQTATVPNAADSHIGMPMSYYGATRVYRR